MKKIISIEGMHCQHCSGRVEKTLQEIDGVKKVKVDLKKKLAEVELSKEIEDKVFVDAIDDAGFEVVEIK